jgi:predicted dehydrogenase
MKKFKIIVAGCGGMSNEWIKYAMSREDSEIVALVDINEENAKKMLEAYKLNCGVYQDINEAIKQSNANLVFDVTIPASHKSIVISALNAGLDVLGEKPIADSMEDAKEMVLAAQKSGKTYAIMQNRRYLKKIRAFKDIVASGVIGEPGFICADFFLGPHFGGFRDIMASPLILDMAIHTFDQARFITGGDPVSVYCQEFNPVGSWYKGNASAVCIFEFSNGSIFCYRGSWCAQGLNTSWESDWRVTGSNGTAIWNGSEMPYYEQIIPATEQSFIDQFKRVDSTFEWNGREGHFGCFDEMFTALLEDRKAETDCLDNIKSMAMVFGAIESAKEGKKVSIKI